MGMENSERMLRRCDVVAENKVKLEFSVSLPCDRCDCVVPFPVGLGEDECICIGIAPPCRKDLRRKLNKTVGVIRSKPYAGHRPLHNACRNVIESPEGYFPLNRRLRHCEIIMSALKMVVREYRTADDRQICIRTDEIVRKTHDEIKQLSEGRRIYRHRSVL